MDCCADGKCSDSSVGRVSEDPMLSQVVLVLYLVHGWCLGVVLCCCTESVSAWNGQ
jgi:hypothetical protein